MLPRRRIEFIVKKLDNTERKNIVKIQFMLRNGNN